ncbi:MAG: hypothetical protein K0U60_07570 [Actinomycetia bacterium]|nr:hypothetical protein [Actinomycetes bacterium]
MGAWSESRTLTGLTWGIVKGNLYMLLFPVVAGVVAAVLVVAVAGVGLGLLGLTTTAEDYLESGQVDESPALFIGLLVLIAAGYLGTLVTQICMAGLVSAADKELRGEDSSFGAGISAALRHLPALLGWAAIQALVGWLLAALRNGGQGGSSIQQAVRIGLAGVAQVAWSVVSFFVLPSIVLRGNGTIRALRESYAMIRITWGMQIAGGVRLGFFVVLLGLLPGIAATVGGVLLLFNEQVGLGIPVTALGLIVITASQVLISTLRAVFSVALFHYAEDGEAVGPYAADQLQRSVHVRS